MMDTHHEITSPVNLGNPEEFTIRGLAKTIADTAGTPILKSPRALPTDDPARRQPGITLAKALLGRAPTVPLREGIVPKSR
jgi:UDP-glucuronate decarboxylase